VTHQTYLNLEIILINDGSTDESLSIIRAYEEKDARIVVIDKPNGGLSSARNAGLDIMTGEYISFIDSDDYLALDTFEKNMKIIEQEGNIEMLVFPSDMVDEKEKVLLAGYFKYSRVETYEYDHKTADSLFCGIPFLACGRIFKSTVFQSLRFPVGRIFEDAWIIPEISRSIKILATSPYGKYYYLQRANSIMGSPINIAKFQMNLEAMRRFYDYCYKELSPMASKKVLYDELKYVQSKLREISSIEKKRAYYRMIFSFIMGGDYFRFFDYRVLKYLRKKNRRRNSVV
jgi:glycosyltransferase involved in cell wall biosynthesis